MNELISIIVPVFNEGATIAPVVQRLLTIDLPAPREIIIVNDGSRDGTRAALDALTGTQPGTDGRPRGREPRQGTRGATRDRAGARHDRRHSGRGPRARSRRNWPMLVAPILRGETTVVYGSRFLAGAHDTPRLTRIANRALTTFTNVLYGSSLTDMETCYKIMRSDVARSLGLTANRFDIEPEITARLLLAGHRIVERPVTLSPRSRAAGKKIGWRDGFAAMKTLVRFRLGGRSRRS